jgi:WD40 repeat protein
VRVSQPSPDGARLVTVSGRRRERVKTSTEAGPTSARAASGAPGRVVRFWHARSDGRDLLFELVGHDAAVVDASFSPDGRQIVALDEAGTFKVFPGNVETLLERAFILLEARPEIERVRHLR